MTDKETIARLESEILAERQRAEQAEGAMEHPDDPNHTCLFKQQLLSALAAIEEAKSKLGESSFVMSVRHELITLFNSVDLSPLHQHDAEQRDKWENESPFNSPDTLARHDAELRCKPLVDLLRRALEEVNEYADSESTDLFYGELRRDIEAQVKEKP